MLDRGAAKVSRPKAIAARPRIARIHQRRAMVMGMVALLSLPPQWARSSRGGPPADAARSRHPNPNPSEGESAPRPCEFKVSMYTLALARRGRAWRGLQRDHDRR